MAKTVTKNEEKLFETVWDARAGFTNGVSTITTVSRTKEEARQKIIKNNNTGAPCF